MEAPQTVNTSELADHLRGLIASGMSPQEVFRSVCETLREFDAEFIEVLTFAEALHTEYASDDAAQRELEESLAALEDSPKKPRRDIYSPTVNHGLVKIELPERFFELWHTTYGCEKWVLAKELMPLVPAGILPEGRQSIFMLGRNLAAMCRESGGRIQMKRSHNTMNFRLTTG